jgi:ABC-type multidrug transport system permease subunit
VGTLFMNADETPKGIRYRMSYLVFTCAFFFYTSLDALPIFLAEREIFQREYSRGAYRGLSYVLASQLVALPFLLFIAFLFCAITWWLVGLENDAGRWFFQVLVLFTVLVTGGAFASMISTIVTHPITGQTVGSGIFSVMFLFSGFFIVRKEIPDYWIWLHYLSLFKYGLDSSVVNAFQYVVETDDATNSQIMSNLSVDGINRGTGVGVLWIFVLAFRFVFYNRLITNFSGSRKG